MNNLVRNGGQLCVVTKLPFITIEYIISDQLCTNNSNKGEGGVMVFDTEYNLSNNWLILHLLSLTTESLGGCVLLLITIPILAVFPHCTSHVCIAGFCPMFSASLQLTGKLYTYSTFCE